MKKILTALLMCLSISALAEVGDTGVITTAYFTNSSGEDVKLVSANPYNDSGYSKFNCLYPMPKKYQDLPSPAFKTMIEPENKEQNSVQYALISAGATVEYAFSSSCDVANDDNKSERLAIRSARNYSKLYVSFGNMYQDIDNGVIDYTKYISAHVIWGNIVSHEVIAPFHVTVLPINQ